MTYRKILFTRSEHECRDLVICIPQPIVPSVYASLTTSR